MLHNLLTSLYTYCMHLVHGHTQHFKSAEMTPAKTFTKKVEHGSPECVFLTCLSALLYWPVYFMLFVCLSAAALIEQHQQLRWIRWYIFIKINVGSHYILTVIIVIECLVSSTRLSSTCSCSNKGNTFSGIYGCWLLLHVHVLCGRGEEGIANIKIQRKLVKMTTLTVMHDV